MVLDQQTKQWLVARGDMGWCWVGGKGHWMAGKKLVEGRTFFMIQRH